MVIVSYLARGPILRQFSTNPQDLAAVPAYRESNTEVSQMSKALHTIVKSLHSSRATFVAVVATVAVILTPTVARAGDPLLEWNDIARQRIVVAAFSPVQQTRLMAIVHVAIHDAVSGISGSYKPYTPTPAAPAGASPEAAAIAAAYRALTGLFGYSDALAANYAASLAANAIATDDPGLAFGEAAADRILILRQDDGAAQAAYPYVPAGAGMPGVWMPLSSATSAQALLPGWGNVTPFVLRNGSQFRPDPPPALDSDRYAKDYNELYEIGGAVSAVRTAEQAQIAQFWRASPTALWNPILRTAITSRGLGLPAAARAAALFYLAASDASVACWEAKYFYNFWRPQSAIANGDADDNPATVADASWRPLVPTPPHPEYPSGHTANSGAMAFVLAALFGDAPGFVIEATSSQTPGIIRSWRTFDEGVREVIDARVYSGIHLRYSDEVGARVGRQVAQFTMTHALHPLKESKSR
jgi:hypothetical protein